MNNKNIIIMGNKKYEHLNIDILIDSFEHIGRINFTIPCMKNAGSKIGTQYLNVNIFKDFIVDKVNFTECKKIYKNQQSDQSLEQFYNFIQNDNNYTRLIYQKDPDISKFLDNYILTLFGCPYKYDKGGKNFTMGFEAILEYLTTDQKKFQKLFIIGMSVDLEDMLNSNTNYDGNKCRVELDGHNYDIEIKIRNWFHINNYIDMTFCLLKDYSYPFISYNNEVQAKINSIIYLVDIYNFVCIDKRNLNVFNILISDNNKRIIINNDSPNYITNKIIKTKINSYVIFNNDSNHLKLSINTNYNCKSVNGFDYIDIIDYIDKIEIKEECIVLFKKDIFVCFDKSSNYHFIL
jgi:hypothetical protein